MLKKWIKPRWQHPDPLVRLEAVGERDLEQGVLSQLATQDPSLDVRRAAIRRLDDLHLLVGLAAVRSPVSESARQRIRMLLRASPDGGKASESLLIEALPVCDDPTLTAQMSRDCPLPRVRLAAVALLRDEWLLTRLACDDNAPEVRLAAAERVHGEEALKEIEKAARNRDKRVAQSARQRLAAIRETQARRAERRSLTEELAARGQGDNWPADEAAWLRIRTRWAELESDATAAERNAYAEAAQDLERRLDGYRAERARAAEIRRHRAELCTELERLTEQVAGLPPETVQTRLAEIQAAWRLLLGDTGAAPTAQTTERFESLIQGLEVARKLAAAGHAQSRDLDALEARIRAAEGAAEPPESRALRNLQRDLEQLPRDVEPSLAERRRSLEHRVNELQQRLEDYKRTERERLQAAESAVAELEQALEQSHLQPALHDHKQASELLRELDGVPPAKRQALEARLRAAGPRLAKLRSWRHWGSDQAREELIGRAVGLHKPGLAPEKVADAVKTLREDWTKLGRLDPGSKPLWERFDAACTRAMEPVLEARRKAAEARKENLERRAELCDRLERIARETDWEQPDWRHIDKTVHRLRRDWRQQGAVDRADWQVVKARYDEAIVALETHLDAERRRNWLGRQAVAERAETLATAEDAHGAGEAARQLREQWQVTVSSPQREEKRLWERFHNALDQVFQREHAQRQVARKAREEALGRAEQLCTELETLERLGNAETLARRGHIAQLGEAFRALSLPPKERKRMEVRFERAHRALEQRVEAALAAREDERLQVLAAYAGLCEQAEQAALRGEPDSGAKPDLRAAWRALPALEDGDAMGRLEARFESALAATADGAARARLSDGLERNLDQCRALCLDLEILLGVESPAEERGARLAHQVQRLARAIGERERDNAPRQAHRLRRELLLTGPLPPEHAPVLRARVERLR